AARRPGGGPLVTPVDVLRDDRANPAAILELGERAMAVVRLSGVESREALAVKAPHLHRVLEERIDRRVLHRVVLRPDTGRRAEVRNPRLGADTGTCQHDARPARRHQVRETLDAHSRSGTGKAGTSAPCEPPSSLRLIE